MLLHHNCRIMHVDFLLLLNPVAQDTLIDMLVCALSPVPNLAYTPAPFPSVQAGMQGTVVVAVTRAATW